HFRSDFAGEDDGDGVGAVLAEQAVLLARCLAGDVQRMEWAGNLLLHLWSRLQRLSREQRAGQQSETQTQANDPMHLHTCPSPVGDKQKNNGRETSPGNACRTKKIEVPAIRRRDLGSYSADSLFPAAFFELLEVGFDGVAILGGHTARQVGHGLDALLLRQLAPYVGVLLELLDIDVATARRSVRQGAVLSPIAGRAVAVGQARRAAAGAAAAVTRAGTLGLVLQLFDFLVELDEHFALHGSCLGSTTCQVEAVLDDAHLASDPVEVFVLPGGHVI